MVTVQYYGLYIVIDGNSMINDTEARNYQMSVWDVLNKMTAKRVLSGHKLWELINTNKKGKSIKVVPSFDPFLQDTAAKPADWSKALAPGQKATPDPGRPELTGVGGGSEVTIPFTPGAWAGMDRNLGYDPVGDLYQADDVLFHELFHALRMLDGVFLGNPMRDGYDFEEEFFGILATNIYVQEQGRPQALRRDHSLVFHQLDQAGQNEFFSKYWSEINKLCEQMEGFTRELQKVNVTFNPIKRYWDSIDHRFDFSRSPQMDLFDLLSH
jgi:hypothetical protein